MIQVRRSKLLWLGWMVVLTTCAAAPGGPTETIFSGDVTFGSSALLEIELAGVSMGPPTEYDRLMIGGTVTLGGMLEVLLIDGFQGAITRDDQFVILEAGMLTGTFANVVPGERLAISGSTSDLRVDYGPSSPFDPNDIVLSDLRLPLFATSWIGGMGKWTDANWDPSPTGPNVFPHDLDDFDFDYDATVDSGNIALDRPITISTLTFNNGSIVGSAINELTVTREISWLRGTLEGAGTTFSDGDLEIATAGTRTLDAHRFESAGTTHFRGGTLKLKNGAIFVNKVGGTFIADSDATLGGTGSGLTIDQSVAGTFENRGMFVQSGTQTTVIATAFDNRGTVKVDRGTLRLDNLNQLVVDTLTDGTYEVLDGATLALPGNIATSAATVILRGTDSSFARFDTLANNQGRFEIRDGRNFDTLGDLANAGQIAIGTGSVLTVNGSYTQSGVGSSIDVAGVMNVAAGLATIANGATLSGTGMLIGPIAIGPDGIVSPGASPGTLTTADLAFADGAVYEWELGPIASDLLAVQGTLTLGSTATLALVDLGGTPDPLVEYVLFTYTGADPINPTWQFDVSLAPLWNISAANIVVDVETDRILLTGLTVSSDFNSDGQLDCGDVDGLVAEIVATTDAPLFDLTGDGIVDAADLVLWLDQAGAANLSSGNSYLVGDANLDGDVDVLDFDVWNAHRFSATPQWCAGDFNADGVVDLSDLHEWNRNKFRSANGANSVPEPTGIIYPFLALIALIRSDGVRRRVPNDR